MKRIIALFAAISLLSATAVAQDGKAVHFGIDASADFFTPLRTSFPPSVGLGVRARLGGYDQWINFVGSLRYIYGRRLSGFQVPLMLNVNLLKGEKVAAYLGGGFEFDFIGTYYGCMKYQAGVALNNHLDFRVFFKPYQGDLGLGFTYYF